MGIFDRKIEASTTSLQSTFSPQLQILLKMKTVCLFMLGFVWVNVQGHEGMIGQPGCDWLQSNGKPKHTGDINKMKCANGKFCTGDDDLETNWDCCNANGGRVQCPKNYPVMCDRIVTGSCGNDYCCEKDGTVLADGEPCGKRMCPAPAKLAYA